MNFDLFYNDIISEKECLDFSISIEKYFNNHYKRKENIYEEFKKISYDKIIISIDSKNIEINKINEINKIRDININEEILDTNKTYSFYKNNLLLYKKYIFGNNSDFRDRGVSYSKIEEENGYNIEYIFSYDIDEIILRKEDEEKCITIYKTFSMPMILGSINFFKKGISYNITITSVIYNINKVIKKNDKDVIEVPLLKALKSKKEESDTENLISSVLKTMLNDDNYDYFENNYNRFKELGYKDIEKIKLN